MQRSRHIAIILPDTLQAIGLQSILTDYFPPVEIFHFNSLHAFTAANTENFDYYFTNADLFMMHADFFLPRRNKILLLLDNRDAACNLCSGNPLSPNTVGYYLFTGSSREVVLEQLQLLFANENQQNPSIDNNNKDLSAREIDVLQLIVKGITNKEIAEKLHISLNTVLTHRKNITSKLGIKTVSGLTFYAIMNGFISGDEIEL